jgi:hypothetical protein
MVGQEMRRTGVRERTQLQLALTFARNRQMSCLVFFLI